MMVAQDGGQEWAGGTSLTGWDGSAWPTLCDFVFAKGGQFFALL